MINIASTTVRNISVFDQSNTDDRSLNTWGNLVMSLVKMFPKKKHRGIDKQNTSVKGINLELLVSEDDTPSSNGPQHKTRLVLLMTCSQKWVRFEEKKRIFAAVRCDLSVRITASNAQDAEYIFNKLAE